jgi:hypothetical protein
MVPLCRQGQVDIVLFRVRYFMNEVKSYVTDLKKTSKYGWQQQHGMAGSPAVPALRYYLHRLLFCHLRGLHAYAAVETNNADATGSTREGLTLADILGVIFS